MSLDPNTIRELADNTTRINQQNYEYFQNHFEELQDEYGGQIIAVHDNGVIESREYTDDLEALSAFFEHLRDEHGEEVAEAAYVTHVPEPNQQMLY